MSDFWLPLQAQFMDYLPNLMAGLVIIVAFWVVSRVARKIMGRVVERVDEARRDVVELFADLIGWGLIILGLMIGLGTMGVDVSALVAGLGLTGFALGFAFKDVLSNIISGVLILFYQPFVRGDVIEAAGKSGRVVDVDLRYTQLQGEGGETILIPNSKLYAEIVLVRKA